jgi:four helix bundle protein
MMDKPHKKLDVWRTSMDARPMVYKITSSFPQEEKFGLVSQMRRAAVSIPSDIAEGAARQGKGEFRNFLSMAQGSLSELDTQIEIALRLGYLKNEDVEELSKTLLRIDKMLTALIRTLSNKEKS